VTVTPSCSTPETSKSGGVARVVAEESSEAFAVDERSISKLLDGGRGPRDDVANARAAPPGAVVLCVLANGFAQVPLAHGDDAPQALALERPHEAFGKRVEVRASGGMRKTDVPEASSVSRKRPV
jgi:hypothetical protein